MSTDEDTWEIRCRFKVEEPEALRERLRDELDGIAMTSGSPSPLVYEFRRQITDMLAQARRIYWPAGT